MMALMATETRDDLSRLVKERRAELGLSLARVVAACGDPELNVSWLSRLEHNQVREIPGRDRLAALSKGLQLPFRVVAGACAAQFLGYGEVESEDGEARAIAARLHELSAAELVQLRAIVDAFARSRPSVAPPGES